MLKIRQSLMVFLGVLSGYAAHAEGVCQREAKTFKSDGFEVHVSFYKSSDAKKHTVLIMPPTGGANFMDRSYASNLCEAGFNAYILDSWSGDREESVELDIHQRLYSRAQNAIDLVLKQIPDHTVGILGTSVGGTHVAVSMTRDLPIDAAFVIVAGAPIADVIVSSDQKAMEELKKKRLKKFGFKTDEEYLLALKEKFYFNALDISRSPARALGMVIATQDDTVPTPYQHQLQKAWNPSLVYEFDNGHRFAIFRTWMWHRKAVVEFFRKNLQTNRYPTPASVNM